MRPSRLALLLLGLCAGPLAVAPAHAASVEAAEHVRLSEEMRKLAQRNLWSAVDQQYRALAALEAKGEVLTVREHELGAQAARNLGDIASAEERYHKAARAGGSPDVIAAIEELERVFGPVRITIDPKYTGDRVLIPAEMPFAPDQRAALDFANRQLAAGGFDGMLMAGTYTLAGRSLTVSLGSTPATMALEPTPEASPGGGGGGLAWAGPRISAGLAFTQAGASEVAGEPGAFGGPGARLGVGVDVGFAPVAGALVQVGYQDLFGGAKGPDGGALEGTDTHPVGGSSLHLGYGWLAASLRFGPVWLAAGPQVGVGGARAWSVTETELDGAVPTPVAGTLVAAGGAGSLGVGLADVGSLTLAVGLEGGALSDGSRLYPWGDVGLTLAPQTRRK